MVDSSLAPNERALVDLPGVDFEKRLATKTPHERAHLRVERVKQLVRLQDSAWLEIAHQTYLLATSPAQDGPDVKFLWQLFSSDPKWTFAQFCHDQLGLSGPDASQFVGIWSTFVIDLGYSPDDLMKAGVAKLKLTLGTVRRQEKQGKRDEELEGMIFGVDENDNPVEPASYREVLEHVMGARADDALDAGKIRFTLAIDGDGKKVNDDVAGARVEYDVVLWRDDIPYRAAKLFAFDVSGSDFGLEAAELAKLIVARMQGTVEFLVAETGDGDAVQGKSSVLAEAVQAVLGHV